MSTRTSQKSVRDLFKSSPVLWALCAILGVALIVVVVYTVSVFNARSVPGDFPTSSVPLASDHVTAGAKSGDDWAVTVQVDDRPEQDAALKKLTDEGYVVTAASGESDTDRVYTLENDKYTVRLTFSIDDNARAVTYDVSPLAEKK